MPAPRSTKFRCSEVDRNDFHDFTKDFKPPSIRRYGLSVWNATFLGLQQVLRFGSWDSGGFSNGCNFFWDFGARGNLPPSFKEWGGIIHLSFQKSFQVFKPVDPKCWLLCVHPKLHEFYVGKCGFFKSLLGDLMVFNGWQLFRTKSRAKDRNKVRVEQQSDMVFIDYNYIWMFPKIGVPQNGWFIRKTLLKWMIWGYPLFWKHLYNGS